MSLESDSNRNREIQSRNRLREWAILELKRLTEEEYEPVKVQGNDLYERFKRHLQTTGRKAVLEKAEMWDQEAKAIESHAHYSAILNFLTDLANLIDCNNPGIINLSDSRYDDEVLADTKEVFGNDWDVEEAAKFGLGSWVMDAVGKMHGEDIEGDPMDYFEYKGIKPLDNGIEIIYPLTTMYRGVTVEFCYLEDVPDPVISVNVDSIS